MTDQTRRLDADNPPPGWMKNRVELVSDHRHSYHRVRHNRWGADTVEDYGPIWEAIEAAGFAAVIKELDDKQAAAIYAVMVEAGRAYRRA